MLPFRQEDYWPKQDSAARWAAVALVGLLNSTPSISAQVVAMDEILRTSAEEMGVQEQKQESDPRSQVSYGNHPVHRTRPMLARPQYGTRIRESQRHSSHSQVVSLLFGPSSRIFAQREIPSEGGVRVTGISPSPFFQPRVFDQVGIAGRRFCINSKGATLHGPGHERQKAHA